MKQFETHNSKSDKSEWTDLKDVEYSGSKKKKPEAFSREQFEGALSNEKMLRNMAEGYVNQYERDGNVSADTLAFKSSLDKYVLEKIKNDHEFTNSDEFRNYSKFLMEISHNKNFDTGSMKLYPELSTNPILANRFSRDLVIRSAYASKSYDERKRISAILESHTQNYQKAMDSLERRLDGGKKLSQKQLDFLGDYIYAGEHADDEKATKFAEYCFNKIDESDGVKASVPMVGALANIFAKNYSIDEDVRKDSRFYVANRTSSGDVKTGQSTSFGCVLEARHFTEMSLTSDESLVKSRTNKHNDIYRLMMVSFHELTHDHQRNELQRGKDSPSAFAYGLNKVLRKDLNCFPVTNLKTGEKLKVGYYAANHDSDEIEIDADEEAWRQSRNFLVEHCKTYGERNHDEAVTKKYYEHWSKCLDNEREVRARRAFTRKKNKNGELVNPIQFDIESMSEKIASDSSVLQEVPAFGKYFENDGKLKIETLYEGKIAGVEHEGLDSRADNFGVEVGTYMVFDSNASRDMLKKLSDKAGSLNETQVKRLTSNLWNILHQDVLKMRTVKDVNFANYDETMTRQNQTEQEIYDGLLSDYMKKLYNCTYAAEIVRAQKPEMSELINKQEQTYFSSYYRELASKGRMNTEYARLVVQKYEKTNNPSLLAVAKMIRADYSIE